MGRFLGTKVEFGADRDEFALSVDARELPLTHACGHQTEQTCLSSYAGGALVYVAGASRDKGSFCHALRPLSRC